MNPSGIHRVGDGLGRRRVFLDGKEMKNVIFADERNGVVVFHDDPPQIAKSRDCFLERTANGKVEVMPWQQ